MADELHLKIVSTADSQGLTKAAKDMGDAKAEANKLADSLGHVGDNAERLDQDLSAATKSVKSHSEQVRLLRAEYEKTKKTIADLDAQLLGGGTDKKSIQKDLRERRAWLAELKRLGRELDVDFAGPRMGPPQLDFGSLAGGGRGALYGGIAGLVALSLPAIGAAVSGAVVGTVATGGVVGGVIAASKDPRVKQAFQSLAADITPEMFGGDRLVEPTVRAIGILKQRLNAMDLDETFALGGPAIENLANGVSALVENALPGFNAVMRDSGRITDELADGLAGVGDGFGDMLTDMVESEGALDGLRATLMFVEGTLRATGKTAAFLGDAFHLAGELSASMSGTLEDVFAAIPVLGYPAQKLMESINDVTENVTGGTKELSSEMHFLSTTTGAAAQVGSAHAQALHQEYVELWAAERKTRDLADAQLQATLSARDLKDAWLELHGGQLTLDQALKRAYDGLKQVKDAFSGPGSDTTTGDSQGAVDRRVALKLEAEAAIAVAQAYLDMTGDAAGAQAKLDDFKKKAEEATGATGAARKEVNNLADALFKLPAKREIYVTTYFRNSFEADFRAGERDSSGRPTTVGIGTRASGGPVMAGVPYMINERGRETVTFPATGNVHPANLTPLSGGYAAPLVLNFPAGSYEQALIETISTAVQARGGQLAVLGLKAA